MQASKVDLAGSVLLNNPSISVLTNGVGLTSDLGKPHHHGHRLTIETAL